MKEEKLISTEKKEDNPENTENQSEKETLDLLESLENKSSKEEELLSEVKEEIKENKSESQKEITGGGVINLLSEKIKKNKFLRATLVGLSLYSANPAFASELSNILRDSSSVTSQESSRHKNFDLVEKLNQIDSISDFNREQLEQIYAGASVETRKVIIDELEKEDKEKNVFSSDSKEDPYLLVLQQQVVDLQNDGEMAPRKKGGVILPSDEGHSGENNNIEYTDDSLVHDEGKQKITIENASENQIRAWIDYLKNK